MAHPFKAFWDVESERITYKTGERDRKMNQQRWYCALGEYMMADHRKRTEEGDKSAVEIARRLVEFEDGPLLVRARANMILGCSQEAESMGRAEQGVEELLLQKCKEALESAKASQGREKEGEQGEQGGEEKGEEKGGEKGGEKNGQKYEEEYEEENHEANEEAKMNQRVEDRGAKAWTEIVAVILNGGEL